MKRKHLEEWREEVELKLLEANLTGNGYETAKWRALKAWIDARLSTKAAA